ncbi:MAG: T9SS type A sorting domain-containing protein [Bacteroidales bacterium]|nr:T9SS type A sorting domain-containing protein [Bacteroidales bacterium]
MGAIAAKAKMHFLAASTTAGSYRFLQFTLNVLGDTELDIFTEDPSTISFSCPDSIPLGNLDNIIFNAGEPQIHFCLNNGDDIYLNSETDFSGNLSIAASPLSFDPIIVTASAHNKIFAVDTIYIGAAENAVVVLDNYSIDAQGKSTIYHGDNVNISVELKNIGIDTAYNTQFHVSEDDNYITLNSNGDSIGIIPPGQSITKTNIVNFDVSNYIPDNYNFCLNTTISDINTQRNENLNLTAYSPIIELNDIEILCDEHKTLMSNDSAKITVNLKNTGGAPVQNLKGLLTSDLAGTPLSIYNFVDSIDQIQPNNEAELNFHLITSTPVGTEIPFILEMNADYYSTIGVFNIEVVDSLENFETGNFELYPWNLSSGDSEWIIDSMNLYNGNYCARSGTVALGEKSIIDLNLNVLSDGYISFYKKTSYMSGTGNYLVFKIDSVLQGYWCGSIDWSREVFPVKAGIHNFRWEYEKFYRTIDTTDWVWIDYIAFPSVTEVSSIDEISITQQNVSIFPNPNTGIFNIVFDQNFKKNISIEIFNMQGVSVYKENINNKPNKFTKQINLGSIAKGVYLIKIKGNESSIVQKIIIN